MSTIVAIVKSLVGQVFAVSLDGLKRQIFEGERLLIGEQVLTGLGGEVTLQLANGDLVNVAQNSNWQAAPSAAQAEDDKAEPSPGLEQALTAGFDPTVDLEAPAAGPGAGGGTGGAAGGGHSFVLLGETGQQLEATIGFETSNIGLDGAGQNELFGADGQTDQATTANANLDTTAPTAPSVNLANDSGTSANDLISNDGTLIIGGVEPGAVVEYSTDGGTTWSNTFTPSEGSNTVSVRQTDTAGNTSPSTSLTFTLDTQVAAPTLALTTDSGVPGDLVSNDGTYSVSGTEPGATVEYSTDGITWSTTAPVAVEGINTIQVRQTDVAGNTSAPSALTFTLDTIPPVITGDAPDNISDATPTISGTTDATDGSTISLSITQGSNTYNVTTTVNGGTYSVDAPTALTDGPYNVTASVTDLAGNTGSATDVGTIDTSAPSVPVVNTQTTSDTTPVITGSATLGAGETLTVTVNGATYTNVPVDGSGNWSLDTGTATPASGTLGSFVDGQSYDVTDAASNTTTDITSGEVTIDTSGPSVVISTNDSNLSVGEATTLTFTFSESVTGFTAGDIVPTGGTISNLVQSTGNSAIWTATFTSTGGGSPSVSLPAGSYTDLAGNAGGAGSLNLNSDPIASNDNYLVSGLVGQYFGYNEGTNGANLTSLSQVETFINGRAPTATFTATNLNYGPVSNDVLGNGTSLQTFLKADAGSLSTDPANTSDAILKLNGIVNLAAGTYQFRVTADDGYSIRINGQTVAEYNGNQGATARESLTFTVPQGGAQQIEIVYWDQGGAAQLTVELRPQGGSYSVLGGSALQNEIPALVTNEDQALTISPATLLGNDTDPDGNPINIISVQGATHGSVALIGGNVVFTPDANYNGAATFTYTVSDGLGGLSTATVTVGVKAVNDAPAAVADSATTNEDTPVTINVLANDTDVDGDSLIVTGATASNGTVVVNADNTLSFTPTGNFSGTALIQYSVSDGKGGTSSSQVTVTVTPQADDPLLSPVANIFALNPGATVISTGSTDTAINTVAFDAGNGISQADLEAELGLTSGFLDGRFNPTGPNVNHNGNVNVNVVDGKVTHSDYDMANGTTVKWNFAFTNGESLTNEVQSGYNDLVVVIVTGPNASRETFLVDSSESKFPSLTSNGSFSYTATQSGNYSFSWLVLNGGDSSKDSSLSLAKASFTQSGSATLYGAPIALSLAAQLADKDGSETLGLVLSGLPAGARLSAGTDNGNGSWTLTASDLNNLHLLPPAGYTGTLNLTLTGTATETANNHTTSSSQSFSITVSETTNTLTNATSGNDTLTGTTGNDLIRGYNGNDTLNGGAGNDHLYGGLGNDTLNGDAGNDFLNGESGNDILNGGAGDDILRGGLGNDTLTGGTGKDLFLWQRGDLNTAGGRDIVRDFNASEGDRIDLHDLLQGENDGNILNYLRVDTATSTLQISTTGQFGAGGSPDVTIKLENGSGGNFNINPGNLSQADLVNSLIAGADPLIKIDHN
ncbi:beta strand repeat-containing protein [Pseudomonas anguilliseptica]|uniref:Type I secretion C-terminal target domain (VC_A0849 subclass) n=1 Tax=Pseudomonas anguilliseptica TaxID=53406 RepID=A0A1H5CRC3_PSEAG|nr:retention module-containing protein [Pseudomonas anguilliseptica]SED69163.1 type I secretion C-terminal target domain (VC_A0849 subclass) [Pseudomonas anguilliseptica]